jgi:sulfur-oxidizing protein SoxX
MSRAAAFLGLLFVSAALADPTASEIEAVLKRDFHARGQATMDRVAQDGLQRVCTEANDRPPAALAKQLEADQMKTIRFPEGSLIGDWQRGEKIAQGGRGLTWSDKAGAPNDGSCYNCHQLSPAELSHGTLGPSLRGFGKARGNGPDAQRYVYGKIYNAKAYNLCSQMPRLGHSGTLTPEQIKDLVALLLDPASPVNR